MEGSTSKQDRGRNGINNVENAVSSLKDMLTIMLTGSLSMFAVSERKIDRMLLGMKEIEELNINGGCIIELESEIGELQNKLIISDSAASHAGVQGKNTKRN